MQMRQTGHDAVGVSGNVDEPRIFFVLFLFSLLWFLFVLFVFLFLVEFIELFVVYFISLQNKSAGTYFLLHFHAFSG